MNTTSKKHFRLVNIALAMTVASVAGLMLTAHLHWPGNERGWLWISRTQFIEISLSELLPMVTLLLWLLAGFCALFRYGSDFRDW